MKQILTIAHFTAREAFRGRIILGSILVSLLIAILSLIASELSYGEKVNIALDVGLGLTHLYAMGLAIFLGSNLLLSEIESRTLYVIISRPIHRHQLIIGKIAGLIIALSTVVFICSSNTLLSYLFLDGKWNNLIILYVLGINFQVICLFIISFFLSLFCNRLLTSMYSMLILIFANFVGELQESKYFNELTSLLFKFFSLIMPNFSGTNFKEHLFFNVPFSVSDVGYALAHIVVYCAAMTLLTIVFFNKKNLD